MKIIILSRNPKLYSTDALVNAAVARGHEVRVVDYLRCYMNITSRKPRIYVDGEELVADAVARIPAEDDLATALFREAVPARALEANG